MFNSLAEEFYDDVCHSGWYPRQKVIHEIAVKVRIVASGAFLLGVLVGYVLQFVI